MQVEREGETCKMAISVECPNCGGSLSPGAGDSIATCSYCGSRIRLDPAEKHAIDPLRQDVRSEIADLLKNGKKVEAIKVHRSHCSGTLKESKLAVEKIGSDAGIPVKTGCCSVIAASLVLLVITILSAAAG